MAQVKQARRIEGTASAPVPDVPRVEVTPAGLLVCGLALLAVRALSSRALHDDSPAVAAAEARYRRARAARRRGVRRG